MTATGLSHTTLDLIQNRATLLGLVLALFIVGCSKDAVPTAAPIDTTANINLGSPQQVIRGFGGVNMPGWIPDMTVDQVNKAFGSGDGQIGMTILRIRVPFDPAQFHLEVPTAQRAIALGARVIASPWTPPPLMKSNNNIVGGTLNTASYAAYAAHLKAFADTLARNGVPLHAISVQNEPDVTVTYESYDWNASQMLAFVKNNAPTIGVNILVPESYNFNHTISDAILNDPAAAANVAIIGGHIYGGGITSYPLAVSKGREVWMTEHLETSTDWTGALFTAKEIHDCMNAGMNAYLWWYIRRFYGPIDDSSNVTKWGYVISQYARFVRPGFTRVGATAYPRNHIYVTAYRNGSNVVIVVVNHGSPSVNQTFTVRNGTVTAFTPYVTSSTKDCVQEADIAVSDGVFTASLDRESVTTLVSN